MNPEPFEISRFIRLKGDNLLMRRVDGNAVWIPITELAIRDQILVRRCHERSPDRRKKLAAQKRQEKGYAGYKRFKSRRDSR